ELWTRFLRAGFRFGVVPEKLLFYRAHPDGVTFGDPRGTFLEMSYAAIRNLVPLIERRAAWPSLARILDGCIRQEVFAGLRPVERYRLLGMLLTSPAYQDFADFRRGVLQDSSGNDAMLITAGRRLLAQATQGTEEYRKLQADIAAYIGA